MILLLILILLATPAAADQTSVTTDQDQGAIIIDGQRPGGSSSGGDPCLDYVMGERDPNLLPGDSIIAIPCHGDGIAATTQELKERVIRYLPPLQPGMSPAANAVVRVPEIFWSGQKALTFTVTVLGRNVSVAMSPSFRWQFGDGKGISTSRSGAPYPNRDVTHLYRRPCRCLVTVISTWSGSWSDGQEWHALGSVLTQRQNLTLDVRRAPIRLTK